MPSILNLKFKGNKSFVAFSNLNDTESLTKTWKVCTKVASYLEQGQRLENLSWRLWHLQNLMVDTDSAKSKREFKKLSKCMGDKLDKEKGRSIEELGAPDFRRTTSTDMIRQRAAEKERYREQNAKPGTIKRMQFTFSVDQPLVPGANLPVKKPDLKPSPEFAKRTRAAARALADEATTNASHLPASATTSHPDDMVITDDGPSDKDPLTTDHRRRASGSIYLPSSSTASQSRPSHVSQPSQSLKFDSIFNSGFGPSALLFPAPTLTTSMNYGEGLNPSCLSNDTFSISRPTIELPLDEILSGVDSPVASTLDHHDSDSQQQSQSPQPQASQPQQDVIMRTVQPAATSTNKRKTRKLSSATAREDSSSGTEDEAGDDGTSSSGRAPKNTSTTSQSQTSTKEVALLETVAPFKLNSLFTTTTHRSNTPSTRPVLTVRTQTGSNNRSSGPGATATSLNPSILRSGGNNAPGGVKAECSNCGATHTPLWRRGLNDELNCNACGLYCKLHKRPRPKSMRNSHGEGRTQAAPRQDPVDVMAQTAQCYNCHTTATPLWRKDDEGKTVCNACGLYYKLHGSARPISMKSDVIRKRSRHDARRGGNGANNGVEETPSASPGVSRRASPTRDPSPTLAPDSTTQMTYEFTQDHLGDSFGTQSELVGALGQDQNTLNLFQNTFQFQFPGPYHPDYLLQMYTAHAQAAAAGANTATSETLAGYNNPAGVDTASTAGGNNNASGASNGANGGGGVSEMDLPLLSPRSSKRRRMSTDSVSEPPSSAVSYSSYESYSPPSPATSLSQRSSMELSFGPYSNSPGSGGPNGGLGGSSNPTGPALRGSGNTFWHPPMMPQGDEHTSSPHLEFHPPMLPPPSSTTNNVSMSNHGGVCAADSPGSARSGGAVEDSPMDYLHPPMSLAGVADDDSLFSAYLHPPMALQEDSPAGSAIVV